MMLLLPPSETKHFPTDGRPLRVEDRPQPLRAATARSIEALHDVCSADPARACEILALSTGQAHWLETNVELLDAPTAPASCVYTGVLYSALDAESLPPAARRRASRQIRIASALFGLVGFDEAIPAYRFSGGTRLPQLPPAHELWQEPITDLIEQDDPSLVVDMRSSAYLNLWKPPPHVRDRHVQVKVWTQGARGQRIAMSHHNKASKGLLARELVRQARPPKTPAGLLAAARRAGELHAWSAELTAGRLDIVLEPDN